MSAEMSGFEPGAGPPKLEASLVGLLLEWAAQDGLVRMPPEFVINGDRAVLKRSFVQRIRGWSPALTGLCVLEGPEVIWEETLRQGVNGARG